jgi:hypothetical protein
MDDIIRREYEKGTPIKEIALLVNRHRANVIKRARKLGLEHPNRSIAEHGKIIEERSLKGEQPMQPTDKQLQAFKAHCDANNLPFDLWRGFWHKTSEFSSFFVNKEAMEAEENRHEQMLADLRKLAPDYKKRAVDPTGEHMLILPQADIHVGKWSEIAGVGSNYDINIALERARVGTADLLAKAKLHGVKQIVVCLGNDVLHTEDGKGTTKGTPQDVTGTVYHAFRLAKFLYISMIEELAKHADVLLVHVTDNHAQFSSYTLSEAVGERFHNHPNVTSMITERHRKYVVFGKNLIMFTHGDGAKTKDLHWHMATESKEAWAKTAFRYVYLGHVHHRDKRTQGHQNVRTEKDLIGLTEIVSNAMPEPDRDVNIQYVRSQSGSDLYHDREGYTSRPAIEAFLHHPLYGKVCDFTHFF